MAKSRHQLLPEVAAKYQCLIEPTRIELQWLRRTIDLRTLTLAEADELVLDPKFTYLQPRRVRKRAAQRSPVN